MKSSRIRLYKTKSTVAARTSIFRSSNSSPESAIGAVSLSEMPSPAAIESISAEQIVLDIVAATLLRVQKSSSAEVAAAAARYLSTIR